MESFESKNGYQPECPYCPSTEGFDIALDQSTIGSNGPLELVSCKNCHKLVSALYPEVSLVKAP